MVRAGRCAWGSDPSTEPDARPCGDWDGALPRANRVERWLAWLGVYTTVVGVSRGQWGLVTFGLGDLILGLGLALFLVRRNARFRRTAAVNGWPIEAATRRAHYDSVPDPAHGSHGAHRSPEREAVAGRRCPLLGKLYGNSVLLEGMR